MTQLEDLLRHLHEVRASDLHVKPGAPPHVRVDGQLVTAPFDAPAPGMVEALAEQVLDDARRQELAEVGEASVAVSVPGLGRFRVNVHRQRGSLAMVIRQVPPVIPELDTLGLPAQVPRFADEERGLVLVSGSHGAGKTTTAAALIDRINKHRACHILTIEDPIEVLHADLRSIVTQRELGTDTSSYAAALRSSLRQDVDVVFVGELVDTATVRAAITAAEVGHLVISTMRAPSALDAVNRLIELFPALEHEQAAASLAGVLRGVLNQRLLQRADGRGRVAAVEVLVGTSKVAEAVAAHDGLGQLAQLMAEGQYHGMQTLDQALLDLVRDGLVGVRDALAASANPEDLRIALSQAGISQTY